jgi:hypothetical protein
MLKLPKIGEGRKTEREREFLNVFQLMFLFLLGYGERKSPL